MEESALSSGPIVCFFFQVPAENVITPSSHYHTITRTYTVGESAWGKMDLLRFSLGNSKLYRGTFIFHDCFHQLKL